MTDKEKYKKELLDKYLSKNLSGDERHELEKLALDDPFLFEALNGFAQANENHAKDLSGLRDRILSEPVKKKSRAMFPYGIAASLLVVVGMSFWLSNIRTENEFGDPMVGVSSSSKTMNGDDMADVAEVVEQEISEAVDGKTKRSKEKAVPKMEQAVAFDKDEGQELGNTKKLEEKEATKAVFIPSNSPVVDGVAVQAGSMESPENVVEMNDEKMSEDVVLSPDATADMVVEENETEESEQEEATVVQEVVVMNKNKKYTTSTTRANGSIDEITNTSANSSEGYNDANQESDLSMMPFDKHFRKLANDQLTRKERRALNDQVRLEFRITNGEVSNFKVLPSQDERLNGLILSIVKSGAQFLDQQNEEVITYLITSL